jgi:hypothetical protein
VGAKECSEAHGRLGCRTNHLPMKRYWSPGPKVTNLDQDLDDSDYGTYRSIANFKA